MNNHNASFIYAILAVLFWSTVATAFKIALGGMSPIELLFFASLTSSIALGINLLYSKKNPFSVILNTKYLLKNFSLGLTNPFLYYFVLFKAYSLLPAQEALALNYTWPITISIFSIIFLKDKIQPITIIGLIVSFIGVLIIATKGNILGLEFHNILGTSLALGSSLIWATFWMLSLKDERKDEETLFASFFWGMIFTLFYILIFDELNFPEAKYLTAAIYVGLFEMGITFLFWLKALKLSTDKAKTSTLAYFSPFISLMFIAFILEEKILLSSIIGLALIISGIVIQNLKNLCQKLTKV